MNNWFVAHTQPRAELLAKSHLERQDFTVYLPRYLKQRRHARRVDLVHDPLFPRYIFIHMDTALARWRSIQSTVGIQYLVCNGDAPAPVPGGIIDEIRAREDDKGLVKTVRPSEMKPGQPVKIIAGAFSGHDALFECATDKQRITVLLTLLSRSIRTIVPLDAVVNPSAA